MDQGLLHPIPIQIVGPPVLDGKLLGEKGFEEP